VSAGLVAPAAAATVAGTGGAVAILIIVFMAATSAASAELIAVSSIITRDVIGLYRPLSGHKMVVASHITIVVFAVWAGCWSTILNKASVDLGWLFYVQGVLLTPAVIPIGLTVMSRRQSKHAAFFGTLFGTACGMIGWMVGCRKIYGEITITNLALPYSAICGSAPGLIMSGLMTGLICLISTFPNPSATTSSGIKRRSLQRLHMLRYSKRPHADPRTNRTRQLRLEIDSSNRA
jgi:Na+/proline symporter